MNKDLRRTLTILAWPTIDTILTVFSNVVLLHFGVKIAVLATIIAMIILNSTLFYLLSIEVEIQKWILRRTGAIAFWQKKIKGLEYGRTGAILAVYTISGPAMAGVPLLWLLGVKKKTAYILIFIGSILNSIVWVGGVYATFWYFAKDLILRRVF